MAEYNNGVIEKFNKNLKICKTDSIESYKTLTALKSAGASQTDNYEGLEFFGDTILKMLATVQVFFEFPEAEEGTLHVERNKIINNNNLRIKALINKFYPYIIQTNIPFYPK